MKKKVSLLVLFILVFVISCAPVPPTQSSDSPQSKSGENSKKTLVFEIIATADNDAVIISPYEPAENTKNIRYLPLSASIQLTIVSSNSEYVETGPNIIQFFRPAARSITASGKLFIASCHFRFIEYTTSLFIDNYPTCEFVRFVRSE